MEREQAWTKQSSTIVACEDIFQQLELDQHLSVLESNPSHISTIRKELPGYKKRAKKVIQDKVLEASQEQARELVHQGEFARLLEVQENNVEWQSLIYSLPRGLLGWAGRATSNSLPTPDNLAKGRIQKKLTTDLVNMVLSVVGGVAAFH